MIKPTFKIWDWFLKKEYINVKDDIGYSLNGLTNQYPDKGCPLHTSIIIKIDFEKNIVETQNSIYELQTCPYQERNQDLDIPMTINNDLEIDRPEVNPVCICKGNWKNLVHEYQPLFGKKFIDETKEIFTFEGLLWANDDFYFCMVDKNHKIHLDTCVGSLETLGYKLYIDDMLNNIDNFNHNSIISISQLDEMVKYNSYVDMILSRIEIDQLQKIGYSIKYLDNLIVRDIDEVNKTMSYLVRITK